MLYNTFVGWRGCALSIGHQGSVEAVQDGVDAVENQIKSGRMFDIILMDLIMPIMNGYEATKEIRRVEQKYNIKESDRNFIAAYTSHADQNVEKKVFAPGAGFDDIVAKPMSRAVLERLLKDHDRRKSDSNNHGSGASPVNTSFAVPQSIVSTPAQSSRQLIN